jgi:2-polyprenyl-3-methyl-5-hydroxy-6-metoxy-1,4-benzoquinol methylase
MYKKIDYCRCCGGNGLVEVLDLGVQPLANSYHQFPSDPLPEYPLKLNVCVRCWHNQLSVQVEPDELFREYLYVSGTSNTLKFYFEELTADLIKRSGLKTGKVLSIACNDGSELDPFKSAGWETYGVDPAKNLVPLAQEKGHTVVCDYWPTRNKTVVNHKYDIIVAQNVFAHTNNILSFLNACIEVMHYDTKLYIQTSQANMFVNGEFDTIYHEHLSFFNTRSMLMVARRAGLWLNRVTKTNIHGQSYLFELGLDADFDNQNVTKEMDKEQAAGLYSIELYDQFAKQAKECTALLRDTVADYKRKGYTVIGAGAAAKGMTVLNYGNIKLDYIIDDNPLKQGLLTPGLNIPIFSFDEVKKEQENIVVVPLAWNFFSEISRKIKSLRPDNTDIFIQYFPSLLVNA